MLKKAISLLLSAVLLFSCLNSVSAIKMDYDDVLYAYSEDTGSGKLIYRRTKETSAAISTDNEVGLLSLAIVYSSEPDNVYQWDIYTISLKENEDSIYEKAMEYTKSHMTEAVIAEIIEIDVDDIEYEPQSS